MVPVSLNINKKCQVKSIIYIYIYVEILIAHYIYL